MTEEMIVVVVPQGFAFILCYLVPNKNLVLRMVAMVT